MLEPLELLVSARLASAARESFDAPWQPVFAEASEKLASLGAAGL